MKNNIVASKTVSHRVFVLAELASTIMDAR